MMRTSSVLIISLGLCAVGCKVSTNPATKTPDKQVVQTQLETQSTSAIPASDYPKLDSQLIVDRLFEELQKSVTKRAKSWSSLGYANTLDKVKVVEPNML